MTCANQQGTAATSERRRPAAMRCVVSMVVGIVRPFSRRGARRLARACALSVAAVAALTGPSAASAERLASCREGTPINGEGSTLQEFPQKKIWGEVSAEAYNAVTQTNAKACPGGPEIMYNTRQKTGSSEGTENWYELDEFGPETEAFAGTEIPPPFENPEEQLIREKVEAQSESGVLTNRDLLTIPTLQYAIAIVVHLPTGCTAESGVASSPKRLVLSDSELEKIFTRKVTKWSQIKEAGDKLVGSACTKTVQAAQIIRVVREDGSGTTAAFKKWLELVNGKGDTVAGEVCDSAKQTWLECAEEPIANDHNINWPEEETDLLRGDGDGGLIEKVEEIPGTIGYALLANARAGKGRFEGFQPATGGGEGTEEFWAEVENGKKVYSEPSTDGDVEAKAKSNCEYTDYVEIDRKNGKAEKGTGVPESSETSWNLVSAEKQEKNYTLCGFSYDLALADYHEYAAHGATEAEATTVGDYVEWVLNDEADGGEALIEKETDYLGLPRKEGRGDVLRIAQEGAAKIGW
jgi:ABC-type phosphate transport system substrate-binding protein